MISTTLPAYTPQLIVQKTEELVSQGIHTTYHPQTRKHIDTVVTTAFQLTPLKELEDKEALILRMHARRYIENKQFREYLQRQLQQYRRTENAMYEHSGRPLITGMITTGIVGFTAGLHSLELLIMTITCGTPAGYVATRTWNAIVQRTLPLTILATYFTTEGKRIQDLQKEEEQKRKETIQQLRDLRARKKRTYYNVEIPEPIAKRMKWKK